MQGTNKKMEENYQYTKKELRSFFIDSYKDSLLSTDERSELRKAISEATRPDNLEQGLIRLNNVLQTRSNYEFLEWKEIFNLFQKFDSNVVIPDF